MIEPMIKPIIKSDSDTLKKREANARFPLASVPPIIVGLTLVTLVTSLAGCGGGGGAPSSQTTPQPSATASSTPTPTQTKTSAVVVAVQPDTARVSPLGTQQFTPHVSNTSDSGLAYAIVEGAGGGTVTGDGLYTAPLTPGTYHLNITSHADPSKAATATITVANQVTITPDTRTITVGNTVSFSAQIPDLSSQAVTWRVLEAGGGTIDDSGLYTPPTASNASGTYHIIATSVQDPTKSGVASVTFQVGGVKGGLQ